MKSTNKTVSRAMNALLHTMLREIARCDDETDKWAERLAMLKARADLCHEKGNSLRKQLHELFNEDGNRDFEGEIGAYRKGKEKNPLRKHHYTHSGEFDSNETAPGYGVPKNIKVRPLDRVPALGSEYNKEY